MPPIRALVYYSPDLPAPVKAVIACVYVSHNVGQSSKIELLL